MIESASSILASLLYLIVRRSTLLSISMESRAFGAAKSRAYYWDVRLRAIDYAFTAAFLTYLITGTLLLTCYATQSARRVLTHHWREQ